MVDQLSTDRNIPIVGIGASAGGLAAFSELLRHLATDTGMGFVLVQHIDPHHRSLLDELLGRTTALPVETAEHGAVIEANHVYVIPPNCRLTIVEGRIQLQDRDQGRQPVKTIDLFLKSLAADQGNRGIAIILSGSNNDGAEGVSAVRAAGGITFAQAPATAKFSGMPDAAIATGQVDFILSPAAIAEQLTDISRHSNLRHPTVIESEDRSAAFQESELSTVFRLLKKHTGVDFADYKINTVQRRLRRRMVLSRMSTLAEYIQHLQEVPSEIQALCQDVLITVTSFFRDGEIYAVLQERVFPRLLQLEDNAPSLRIWVPGCATGEEVYSIAICLFEYLSPLLVTPAIQIFGTDISEAAIEEARLGIYQASRLEGLSPERRRRFFTEIDSGFQINNSVRELCIFARQDLSSDPPFSDLDLVSCRNVLIYFKPPLQQRVLSVFHYGLKPTGLLVLGNSESVGDKSELFKVFDDQAKIYSRQAVPTHLSFDFVNSYQHSRNTMADPRQSFSKSLSYSNVQQWADQIVLSRYAPVGVIVNEALEILQFRGETSAYLRPPLGEPSFNLLKMARPSLLIGLQQAIGQAKRQGGIVKRQQRLDEAQPDAITVEVIPFNATVTQERCFLVLFERGSDEIMPPVLPEGDRQGKSGEPTDEPTDEPTALESEMHWLRQELASTRQELLDTQTFLQLTIEEQESTNQQLVAANEEILSSNEELKSTNEELQTAKEEVQSANEELKTTNEELQSRNTESSHANDDLVNLLKNVNIPILMLSSDLRIRRFTPMMRSLFNLIPSDVGRPINDIRFDIDIPDLETWVSEVLETLTTLERDVQDLAGRWYLLRIRPYRTVENHIDGVVLVLLDVNNLKQTEQTLQESQAQLETELFAMNQVQMVSRQLSASLDLTRALNEMLDAAIAIQHADMGCVHMYDPDTDSLTMAAHRGLGQDFLDHFYEVRVGDGSPYSQALEHKQRIIIRDVQLESGFEPHRQIAAAAGFRSVQSTPLIGRDGMLWGVLSTHFAQPHRPTESELRMLDLYGRQAAEFIGLIRAEAAQQLSLEREQIAQAANDSKDQLLSVLSQELQTPLSSIMSWIRLIELETPEGIDLAEAIASIKSSALMQLQLVENVLDVSRIIHEGSQLDLQPTDLTHLLHQATAIVQPHATAQGLQLESELEQGVDHVMINSDRMAQVFSALLLNAITFTPSGGRITVSLTALPTQVQVQVRDTGQGIRPEVLPHLFDLFCQADAADTRRQGSLGLGLFLVRSIVEAHGGTIEATSAGEDQGATFTITLPLEH